MSADLYIDDSFDMHFYHLLCIIFVPNFRSLFFIINNVPKSTVPKITTVCNKMINFRFLLCLIIVPKFNFCLSIINNI